MSFSTTAKTQLKGSAVVVDNAPGSTTAVSFPGTTGNYVQIDTSQASPSGNNIFIEAWVYFGSIGSTAQTIFSMGSASTEYMSIKVADQGGPEIAGPFTCSTNNGSLTFTASSAIGRSFTLNNMYYNPGYWLDFQLPQPAQYWGQFQIQIYITKLAGTPAMSRPDVFVQADFDFDDGNGNWINLGTVDLLNFGVTWPAGIYNTTYTWMFPTGIPTVKDRNNPTLHPFYRFRVRGGGTIDGNFYDIVDLLNTNLAVFSGYYNDFIAQANQWNHLAFAWTDDWGGSIHSFCNGMWVRSELSSTPLFSAISSVGASNAGTATPFNGYVRDLRIIRGGYIPNGSPTNYYQNPNFVPDQTFGAGTVPSYVYDGTNVFNLLPIPTFLPVSFRITAASTGCKMYNSPPAALYSFTSFTFTPMGATGVNGPGAITYGTSTPGYGTASVMTLSGGMQLWTVPASGNYTFTVAGAAGGAGGVAAGKGAVITVTLALTQGDVLKLLVGQKGTSATSFCPVTKGAGGGGTFVYNNTTSTILLVAGGGGGGAGGPIVTAGLADASLTTSGNNGDGGATSGAGGTAGGGGAGASPACTVGAGGGGGLTGNGTNGVANGVAGSSGPNGGKSFTNGGTGGTDTNENTTYGGFGGGGASGNHCGGGGGGYSGGGGGGLRTCSCGDTQVGGGGGSYATVSFTSSAVTNTGDGYITITRP